MRDEEKPKLAEWLTGCSEVYGREISPAGIAVWWNIVQHFPAESVERAFTAHVADPDTGRRMPTPADIVGRIMGGSETAAVEAWTKVMSVSRPCGWSRNVVFDDPLIHACVDSLGGWETFCRTPDEDLGYRRKSFIDAYKGFRQRREVPKHAPVCVGQYPREPVTLVGDPHKARSVFRSGIVPEHLPRLSLLALSDNLDETLKRIAQGSA
jgi:Domain of unknown function (DUF6475)